VGAVDVRRSPHGRAARGLLFAAVALLQGSLGFSQVRQSITVEVIDVPVYVIAPDGKPVRGLAREAFTLVVDGKRQPIEYFDVFDFGRDQSTQATREQRARRLYLFLFDVTFSDPIKLARAQAAAEKAVANSNPATDLFAVARYSNNRGVFFITPFLSDRVAIKRALFTLRTSTAHDALGLNITDDERSIWEAAAAAGISSEMLDAIRGGKANQENVEAGTRRLIESQFEGLGEVAKRITALEGQKHVLFFSQGFEAGLVHDIPPRVPGPPQFDAQLLRYLQEMQQQFRAAGVILDSVDIAGLRHTFNNMDNDALFMLARDTGGQVIHNKNDFAAAITDLTTSQQLVYLLGFRRSDDRPHRIAVRVQGAPRGSSVFNRTGFGAPAKLEVDALQLADIILNDVPQNGFTVDLDATSGGSVVVRFHRADAVPQIVDKSPYVDALIYVFNRQGEAVASSSKRISVDRDGPDAIAFQDSFALPTGSYVAKALLRIAGTNALAFARREFVVQP
jgi:VWFA-related protein